MVDRLPNVGISNFLRQVSQVNLRQNRPSEDQPNLPASRLQQTRQQLAASRGVAERFPTRDPDPRVDAEALARQLTSAQARIGAEFGDLLAQVQVDVEAAIAREPGRAAEFRSLGRQIEVELARSLASNGIFEGQRYFESTVSLGQPSVSRVNPSVVATDFTGDEQETEDLQEAYDRASSRLRAGGGAAGPVILDYTIPPLRFDVRALNPTVNEPDAGTTPAVFEIKRTGTLSGTEVVEFKFANGTTSNADFKGSVLPPAGKVTFNPGDVAVLVTAYVKGDFFVEGDENFSIEIFNPTKGIIGTNAASTTIIDNDVGIRIDDVTKLEGQGGLTDFVFTVNLVDAFGAPRASSSTTVADFAVVAAGGALPPGFSETDLANGAANDFNGPLTGKLTFAAGVTTQTFTVQVRGDKIAETDEAFQVQLKNLSLNVDPGISDLFGLGKIITDEPTFKISVDKTTIVEGNFDPVSGVRDKTAFVVTVDRVFAAGSDTNIVSTVKLNAAGTGVAGSRAAEFNDVATGGDFVGALPTLQNLTFAAGQLQQTFTYFVAGDNGRTNEDPDETFKLFLSNATGAQATTGADSVGVTIQNDDSFNIQINKVDIYSAIISETNAPQTKTGAQFSITRQIGGGLAGQIATVDFKLVGQAKAVDANPNSQALDLAQDQVYVVANGQTFSPAAGAIAGRLTFTAGQTAINFRVYAKDDADAAPIDRLDDFKITISNPTGGELGGPASQTGRILDNDPASTQAIFTVETDNAALNKGFGAITVTQNEADAGGFTDFVYRIRRVGENLTTAASVDVKLLSSAAPNTAQGATIAGANSDFVSIITNTGTFASNATATVDFAALGAGVTQQDIQVTVRVKGDDLVERNEGFQLQIQAGSISATEGLTITGRDAGFGIIKNNDLPLPVVEIFDTTPIAVAEGGGFIVKLDRGKDAFGNNFSFSQAVQLNVSGIGVNPTENADFTVGPNINVNFGANQQFVTVTINTKLDTLYEADGTATTAEDFRVKLVQITEDGGTQYYKIGANNQVDGQITNDDPAPSYKIAANASATEGGNVVFTVTRTGADTSFASSVAFEAFKDVADTADLATDLAGALTGVVNFAAGQTSATVTIKTIGDTIFEGGVPAAPVNETFSLKLIDIDPFLGTIDPAFAQKTGTIIEDDTPTLNIDNSSVIKFFESDAPGFFQIKVFRTGDVSGVAEVGFAVTNNDLDVTIGEALATDFGGAFPTGTITFTAGQTVANIKVNFSDNLVIEADPIREFQVKLLAGSEVNAKIGGATFAQGTVFNDD